MIKNSTAKKKGKEKLITEPTTLVDRKIKGKGKAENQDRNKPATPIKYPRGKMLLFGRAGPETNWAAKVDETVTPNSQIRVKSKLTKNGVTVLDEDDKSPGGTEYVVRLSIGAVSYCRQKTPVKPSQKRIKRKGKRNLIQKPLFNLEQIPVKKLTQTITITPEQFKNLYRIPRRPSQNSCFNNISANDKAIELKLPAGRYEYCHLIAFRFSRNDGQNKKNLILGTYECNTHMLYLENIISFIVKQGHTVTVNVTAEIDCSSKEKKSFHVGKQIDYLVTVRGKTHHFIFDPQSHEATPPDFQNLMIACFETTEEYGKINMESGESSVTPPTPC